MKRGGDTARPAVTEVPEFVMRTQVEAPLQRLLKGCYHCIEPFKVKIRPMSV